MRDASAASCELRAAAMVVRIRPPRSGAEIVGRTPPTIGLELHLEDLVARAPMLRKRRSEPPTTALEGMRSKESPHVTAGVEATDQTSNAQQKHMLESSPRDHPRMLGWTPCPDYTPSAHRSQNKCKSYHR